MLKRHRVSRIYWNRHFFDYPISLSPNTLKAMGPKLTLVAGFSYLKSMVHKLPEDNLENFYINRFGRKLYSMFFEGEKSGNNFLSSPLILALFNFIFQNTNILRDQNYKGSQCN